MRNTIYATLTAITLTLCTALAGCGSASEPSTPAHAVRSVDSQCSAGADVFTECVITQEGVRTFENIDDAGDYAQAMSLRTGEPVKVFNAETGLVAFTVRSTTKDTK
ncbi:hypothetical protein [Bifidobacterium adolescentis]|uniref:hypothetical protein n=1 Tax=Bifidobacterium adolescentis TaxID=1680 RepID=UPI003B999A73